MQLITFHKKLHIDIIKLNISINSVLGDQTSQKRKTVIYFLFSIPKIATKDLVRTSVE